MIALAPQSNTLPMKTKQSAKGVAHGNDTTQLVYQAVCDLHTVGRPASRDTVQEMTGLKLTIIDDRLKYLVDGAQSLIRISRGHYEPSHEFPEARVPTLSTLQDGSVKLEIGDDMLLLTPKEARMTASMMSGLAETALAIMVTRPLHVQNAELASKIDKLERKLAAMQAERSGKNPAQMSLPHCEPA